MNSLVAEYCESRNPIACMNYRAFYNQCGLLTDKLGDMMALLKSQEFEEELASTGGHLFHKDKGVLFLDLIEVCIAIGGMLHHEGLPTTNKRSAGQLREPVDISWSEEDTNQVLELIYSIYSPLLGSVMYHFSPRLRASDRGLCNRSYASQLRILKLRVHKLLFALSCCLILEEA